MAQGDPLPPELAIRFRAARRLAEISLERGAKDLGVSRSTLIRIEAGTSKLRSAYIQIAIQRWNAPSWPLPTNVAARDGLALGGRSLLEGAQRHSAQTQDEIPADWDVAEGRG